MRAAGGEERSDEAVVTIANRRPSFPDSDTFSQSFSKKGANPMRGERRFIYSKRLDWRRAVCHHRIDDSRQTWRNRHGRSPRLIGGNR